MNLRRKSVFPSPSERHALEETISQTKRSQAMEFHEYANVFPLIEGKEFEELTNDIKQNGLAESIYTHRGKIIDGRNRYRACIEAGVEPRFQEWNGEQSSIVRFILSKNVRRRNLTEAQRVYAVLELEPIIAKEAQERQVASRTQTGEKIGSKVPVKSPAPRKQEKGILRSSENATTENKSDPVAKAPQSKQGSGDFATALDQNNKHGETRENLAQMAETSVHKIRQYSKVKKNGVPELNDAVKASKISPHVASEISELPHDEQRQIVQEPIEKICEKSKEIKKSKKMEKVRIEPEVVAPKKEEDAKQDNKYGVPFPQDCVRLTVSERKGSGIFCIAIEKPFDEVKAIIKSIFEKECEKYA
jgi:ParB-like chromosome segregation protein Spo0J